MKKNVEGHDPDKPIGPGNPPKSTQFGQPGGNKQYPKKLASQAKVVKQRALDRLTELVSYGNEDEWVEAQYNKEENYIIRQFAKAVNEGDIKQANYMFDHAFGKAAQKIFQENTGSSTQVIVYRPEKGKMPDDIVNAEKPNLGFRDE